MTDQERTAIARRRAWEMVFLLGFGMAVLAYLTVIERRHWAPPRPAGGRVAMAREPHRDRSIGGAVKATAIAGDRAAVQP